MFPTIVGIGHIHRLDFNLLLWRPGICCYCGQLLLLLLCCCGQSLLLLLLLLMIFAAAAAAAAAPAPARGLWLGL